MSLTLATVRFDLRDFSVQYFLHWSLGSVRSIFIPTKEKCFSSTRTALPVLIPLSFPTNMPNKYIHGKKCADENAPSRLFSGQWAFIRDMALFFFFSFYIFSAESWKQKNFNHHSKVVATQPMDKRLKKKRGFFPLWINCLFFCLASIAKMKLDSILKRRCSWFNKSSRKKTSNNCSCCPRKRL